VSVPLRFQHPTSSLSPSWLSKTSSLLCLTECWQRGRPRRRPPHPQTPADPRASAPDPSGPGPAADRTARGRPTLTMGSGEPGQARDARPQPLRSEPARRRRDLERLKRSTPVARPPPAHVLPNRASRRRRAASAATRTAYPLKTPGPRHQELTSAARADRITFGSTGTDHGWISFYGAGRQDARRRHASRLCFDGQRPLLQAPRTVGCGVRSSVRGWLSS